MSELLGLAKDCLDIGVFTQSLEPMLEFWQQSVGLEFDHMLPVGGGVRQHRHELAGSVLKLNHSRQPLGGEHAQSAGLSGSGYLRILIAHSDVDTPRELKDPDGNLILFVSPGFNGITQWAIEVATGSVAEFLDFYESGEMNCLISRSRSRSIKVRRCAELASLTQRCRCKRLILCTNRCSRTAVLPGARQRRLGKPRASPLCVTGAVTG